MVALIIGVVMIILPNSLIHRTLPIEASFVIERGQSLGSVARSLAKQDLILNKYLFVIYAIASGNERNFKAGNYKIPANASIGELVNIFAEGRSEPEGMVVTIPEGTNIADADRILTKANIIKAGEFLGAALQHEGYLFPDTYRFNEAGGNNTANNGVEEIVKKMRENFELKTVDVFKGISQPRIKEIVITASILEREVKTEQDMKIVAGIIEKRFSLDLPLEIDATVAYGVCYPEFLFGRICDVSLANIVDNIPKNSVYNTYKRKGLPIGPITNPGLTAINAALNPQPSDYLFYLSARDGTTIFSKTAEEHARARAKYLKL